MFVLKENIRNTTRPQQAIRVVPTSNIPGTQVRGQWWGDSQSWLLGGTIPRRSCIGRECLKKTADSSIRYSGLTEYDYFLVGDDYFTQGKESGQETSHVICEVEVNITFPSEVVSPGRAEHLPGWEREEVLQLVHQQGDGGQGGGRSLSTLTSRSSFSSFLDWDFVWRRGHWQYYKRKCGGKFRSELLNTLLSLWCYSWISTSWRREGRWQSTHGGC